MQDKENRFASSTEKGTVPAPTKTHLHTSSVHAPPFDPTFSLGMEMNSEIHGGRVWAYPSPYMMGCPLTKPYTGGMAPFQGLNFSETRYEPRRENAEREGLSIYAKPWRPSSEMGVDPIMDDDKITDFSSPSFLKVRLGGVEVSAPAPIISKEVSDNIFIHVSTVTPRTNLSAEFKLLNYSCGRCPLKTLFGRLSSRKADVSLRNIAPDLPPLCIAHLIEQQVKAKVTAIHQNELDSNQYEVWLDKPNASSQVVEMINDSLWTCPLFHGFAVLIKSDESRKFLKNYLDELKKIDESKKCPYPLAFVEVKEH